MGDIIIYITGSESQMYHILLISFPMSIDTSPIELEDPLAWAKEPETYSEWIREIAPKYDLDVQKYLLGDVLSTITNDDTNCVGHKGAMFSPETVQLAKESLLIRLKWETSLEETPEDIRKQLRKFTSIAEETDWLNEESYFKIKEAWYKNVRGFVKHQIALNESYRDAINYEFDMAKIIHPEYKALLFGKQK